MSSATENDRDVLGRWEMDLPLLFARDAFTSFAGPRYTLAHCPLSPLATPTVNDVLNVDVVRPVFPFVVEVDVFTVWSW